MSKRVAIIDLGTNTCNLLIAKYEGQYHQILFQGKEVVKLGKNGIDKNMLDDDGLERAIQAIRNLQERIAQYDVSETIVLGTSAIREAKNQAWFQNELERRTGITLQIISGEKEADLIYKGVKLAFGYIEDQSIILDIGGGSNELILTQAGEPVWKQSYPLGMARTISQIPPSDPITQDEVNQITSYFESGLDSLWKRTKGFENNSLIGCSGAFDSLADLIDETEPGTKIRVRQEVKISDFERIYHLLLNSTTAERENMKGLESLRIEMIVPSVILIKLIVDRLKIQKIHQTDYALREGILYELIFS